MHLKNNNKQTNNNTNEYKTNGRKKPRPMRMICKTVLMPNLLLLVDVRSIYELHSMERQGEKKNVMEFNKYVTTNGTLFRVFTLVDITF